MKLNHRHSGFTLIELMVTLVVAIIIIGIAIPSYQSMIQANRAAAVANDLVSTLMLARSEAVKRNTSVSLCATTAVGASTCSADRADWTNGWMVFVDNNSDGIFSSGDVVIFRQDAPTTNAGFTATPSQVITYSNNGFLANGANGNYDLQLSGCKGDLGARRITLSTTGRPSASKLSCN